MREHAGTRGRRGAGSGDGGVSVHPSAIDRSRRRGSGVLHSWPILHHRPARGARRELHADFPCGSGRTHAHRRATTSFIPSAPIGVAPQDLKYGGEPTETVIGDENTIRESVTISRGTVKGGGVTRLGSNCLLMAYVHIGHDSQVGSHCILANAPRWPATSLSRTMPPWAPSARCTSSALWANMPLSAAGPLSPRTCCPIR